MLQRCCDLMDDTNTELIKGVLYLIQEIVAVGDDYIDEDIEG